MSRPDGRSLGAFRVRESFNPSQDSVVDQIKRYTADLIDLCQKIENGCDELPKSDDSLEQIRLCRLAMTHYEIACMFGVKAATTGK